MGRGGLRQLLAAVGVVTLLLATACSGDGEAEGSGTAEPAPATSSEGVEAGESEEANPAAWRIRANAECNSMVSFYEAPFRKQGGTSPSEIAANSAETLRNWHAAMIELGALAAGRATYEEALDRYEDAIAAFETGSGGSADFERANELMADLGLETCVDVVDLVRSGVDPYVDEDVVVHEEDFTDPTSRRWTVNGNKEIAFAYVRGRYRVRVIDAPGNTVWLSSTNWAGEPRQNVRVEIDTVLSDRASGLEIFGVLCLTSRGRGYFFGIGPPEGRWSIEKAARRFELLDDGIGEDAVRQRVNHVGGECRGGRQATRVRLFVNGKVVGTYRDRKGYRQFTQIGIAVFAPEGGLEVLFDNARATELRPRQQR